MKLNKSLIALLALSAIAIMLFLSSCSGMIEGIVDHKSVTGKQGNTSYSILLYRPEIPWVLVEDESLTEYFTDEDQNPIISQQLEQIMKQKYKEVYYWVSVLPNDTEGDVQTYQVSRETFNSMEVGSRTRD